MKLKGILRRLRFSKESGDDTPLYTIENVEGRFLSAIKIRKGKFKGVCYFYGDVSVDRGTLRFVTEIHENPNDIPHLSEDDDFTKITGDILFELLQKQFQTNDPVLVKK